MTAWPSFRGAENGQPVCSKSSSGAGMTAPLWRWARKGLVTVAGITLLAGGTVMLVLPGTGVAVILAGPAVLAAEYDWAAHLLAYFRQYAARMSNAAKERWRRRQPGSCQRPAVRAS